MNVVGLYNGPDGIMGCRLFELSELLYPCNSPGVKIDLDIHLAGEPRPHGRLDDQLYFIVHNYVAYVNKNIDVDAFKSSF